MREMIITRGLPGSGKSTLARKLFDECPSPLKAVCSTDDFRCHTDGLYKYDPKQNHYMHGKTHKLVQRLVELEYDLIIVDNTHTQWREMRNFVMMGIMYGYRIRVVESETEWAWDVAECTRRNTHNVPREAIQAMFDRYTPSENIREHIDGVDMAYQAKLPCLPDGWS